jgi:hypothetical protein
MELVTIVVKSHPISLDSRGLCKLELWDLSRFNTFLRFMETIGNAWKGKKYFSRFGREQTFISKTNTDQNAKTCLCNGAKLHSKQAQNARMALSGKTRNMELFTSEHSRSHVLKLDCEVEIWTIQNIWNKFEMTWLRPARWLKLVIRFHNMTRSMSTHEKHWKSSNI